MELILIRHAEPAWVDDGAALNDPGLSERGSRQAKATGEIARTWPDVSELLVSPARRSQETAAPIAEGLGIEPVTMGWLHEIRLPDHWDGTPAEEVARAFREMRVRPAEEWWDGIPGGETFSDFHERVVTGLELTLAERGARRTGSEPESLWELDDEYEGHRMVIVAHAGTDSSILSWLLGVDPVPWEWERFSSNHASVSVLWTTPIAGRAIWSLQRFSDVSHLDLQDITS